MIPLRLDLLGEGERSGDEDGLRGGDGNLEPDLDFLVLVLPSPISRA
jgi:hypothetical protein